MEQQSEQDTSITFVAIGPFAWGKGDTVSEAVANCKREIPRSLVRPGKQSIYVYRVVGFSRVNDMGGLVTKRGGSAEKVDEQTVTIRGR